ncbi:hypothetical protein Tco_1532594 [Tanacetum coccineum]
MPTSSSTGQKASTRHIWQREGQGNDKECGTPCKVFQDALQNQQRTTFELLQTPGNKTEDTTPRETSGSQYATDWEQCLTARDMALCKGNQEPKQDTDEEIDEQELEAHYSYMAKIQEVSPEESSSTGQPLEQYKIMMKNVFDERAALANLTLDTEENKTILKQLKKANASFDSIIESTKPLLTDIDYEILQTKLNETLGLLALKDIEIKEGLKTKAYEISVLNQKHDELVKKSLLTKSQLEGYLKENTKIPYDTSDPANRIALKGRDMTLDNESRSKLNKDYVKPYDYTNQNSLYEIFKGPSLEYLYQLERAKEVRKTMWRKPFVRTKPNIAKNVSFLPVSKSISKSRQVFNEMTFNINQFREIVDQTWFKHTSDYFRVPTAHDMELLIKTFLMPLSIKSQNDSFRFEHELKTEMHEDFEYVKSLEKEIDELESEKADFSNMYDLLLEECVSKDVICSYLHSLSELNAHTELQCMYLHKVKECECLAQKLSKQTESVNNEVHNKLLKSFAKLEKHSISLELSLQHCKEQMKNNPVCKENASNVFRKEREQYHEIQDLKAQMQDKNMVINELKKLILVTKGKSVETQFDKPSVVRQPNAQRIPKPSVLGKPTPFSIS